MSEEKPSTPARRKIPHLLWGMIRHPRGTLEYLSGHTGRTWWAPAALAVLLTVLPVIAAAPLSTRQRREAIITAREQQGEQQREMSAEEQAQMEQAISVAASPLITTVFPAAGSAVGTVARWLVWAGALHLAGTALGGRSTFGQMFRTVVWTWIPYTVRGLLQTVYILASGQLIENPGLSGFAQGSPSAARVVVASPNLGQIALSTLLGRVDLYLFWNLALLVLGVMTVTRLSRRKALLLTLGVWLLLTAVSLVPSLVGGAFARQVGVP
jgi:hypothetical protein